MKKQLWIIATSFVLLAACGSNSNNDTTKTTTTDKGSWRQAEKEAFVKSCIPQAQQSANMDAARAKDYCECMLGKVEEKYPKALEAAGLTATEASAMAQECVQK